MPGAFEKAAQLGLVGVVAPGWIHRLWGLPLYYAGQVLLASSVG